MWGCCLEHCISNSMIHWLTFIKLAIQLARSLPISNQQKALGTCTHYIFFFFSLMAKMNNNINKSVLLILYVDSTFQKQNTNSEVQNIIKKRTKHSLSRGCMSLKGTVMEQPLDCAKRIRLLDLGLNQL